MGEVKRTISCQVIGTIFSSLFFFSFFFSPLSALAWLTWVMRAQGHVIWPKSHYKPHCLSLVKEQFNILRGSAKEDCFSPITLFESPIEINDYRPIDKLEQTVGFKPIESYRLEISLKWSGLLRSLCQQSYCFTTSGSVSIHYQQLSCMPFHSFYTIPFSSNVEVLKIKLQ